MNQINKKIFKIKAFTLIDLLFSLVMISFLFFSVYFVGIYTLDQISVYSQRHDMYSQINYAIADLEQRIPSAMVIDPNTLLLPGANEINNFIFQGEKDVFVINHNVGDNNNVVYTYSNTTTINGITGFGWSGVNGFNQRSGEILIEERYHPQVRFMREDDDEPNFLTVEVRIESNNNRAKGLARVVVKRTGIRLLYVDVVQRM